MSHPVRQRTTALIRPNRRKLFLRLRRKKNFLLAIMSSRIMLINPRRT
jgi:hypothetical protein